MSWTINGNRIYVTGYERGSKRIIARLQPISGSTILQSFGYDSPIHQFECKVVGNTILDAIEALVPTGGPYTLTGPNFTGSFYISSVRVARDLSQYQTLDTGQACETPVYTLTMELYE